MATSQLIENKRYSYEIFEQKHYMECTTVKEGFNQVVVGWSSEDCAMALADCVTTPAGGEPWGLRAPKASVPASSSRVRPRTNHSHPASPGAIRGPARPLLSHGRTGDHATGWARHPPGQPGRSGDREGGAPEGALRPVVGPGAPECPRITP
jgi:hypothetical protein